MNLIKESSKDNCLKKAAESRECQENKLKRTLVEASDLAGAKVRGIERESGDKVSSVPQNIIKVEASQEVEIEPQQRDLTINCDETGEFVKEEINIKPENEWKNWDPSSKEDTYQEEGEQDCEVLDDSDDDDEDYIKIDSTEVEVKLNDIKFEDVMNSKGPVGFLVNILKDNEAPQLTLKNTADTWRLVVNVASSQNGDVWSHNVRVNGVLLGDGEGSNKTTAKAMANTTAMLVLLNHYYTVKVKCDIYGGKGYLDRSGRVIDPNNHPTLKSCKHTRERYKDLILIKQVITAYSKSCHYHDLVLTSEFTYMNRMELGRYSERLGLKVICKGKNRDKTGLHMIISKCIPIKTIIQELCKGNREVWEKYSLHKPREVDYKPHILMPGECPSNGKPKEILRFNTKQTDSHGFVHCFPLSGPRKCYNLNYVNVWSSGPMGTPVLILWRANATLEATLSTTVKEWKLVRKDFVKRAYPEDHLWEATMMLNDEVAGVARHTNKNKSLLTKILNGIKYLSKHYYTLKIHYDCYNDGKFLNRNGHIVPVLKHDECGPILNASEAVKQTAFERLKFAIEAYGKSDVFKADLLLCQHFTKEESAEILNLVQGIKGLKMFNNNGYYSITRDLNYYDIVRKVCENDELCRIKYELLNPGEPRFNDLSFQSF